MARNHQKEEEGVGARDDTGHWSTKEVTEALSCRNNKSQSPWKILQYHVAPDPADRSLQHAGQ
jgi:hypothetical protein